MSSHTRTLGRPVPSIQYPRRGGMRVTQELARRLGKTEAYAHRQLYEHPSLRLVTVTAIEAYRAAGDDLGLARFAAPIMAAIDRDDPVPLTAALMLDAQDADGAEDVAEFAYLANPCHATAEALLRAKDRAIVKDMMVRRALVEKWGV